MARMQASKGGWVGEMNFALLYLIDGSHGLEHFREDNRLNAVELIFSSLKFC